MCNSAHHAAVAAALHCRPMAKPPQVTPGSSTVKTVARRLSRIEALLLELQFTLERHVKRIGKLQAQVDELGDRTEEALKKIAATRRR